MILIPDTLVVNCKLMRLFTSDFFFFADRGASHRQNSQHGQKDEEQVVWYFQNEGSEVKVKILEYIVH